ncbi:uncharacterized protein LAESUDRAFT_536661 [Laetiporus sulphureus 93-53]|uniref:Uncharacterized protein n=1 Tax=Laetiporus sulphureus 93-53 TaxID=1314785 RepID=A0A165BA59_9APHY|nr:uncharacterized protein LAESUDRAFT_536661 [Laetiporus sulphureus 93-53]KZT00602.1 hypothetical protein LAESUDRAFT_536661 [Laetiporus sulphureus 93-53]
MSTRAVSTLNRPVRVENAVDLVRCVDDQSVPRRRRDVDYADTTNDEAHDERRPRPIATVIRAHPHRTRAGHALVRSSPSCCPWLWTAKQDSMIKQVRKRNGGMAYRMPKPSFHAVSFARTRAGLALSRQGLRLVPLSSDRSEITPDVSEIPASDAV